MILKVKSLVLKSQSQSKSLLSEMIFNHNYNHQNDQNHDFQNHDLNSDFESINCVATSADQVDWYICRRFFGSLKCRI